MPVTQVTKANQSVYFEDLNGFRTIAFLLVFLQHSFFEWMAEYKADLGYVSQSLRFLLQSGGIGVSAFFVLSGFLITYLLISEKENHGRINVWHFYMRRLLRIWPLYYALLIYGFVIYPFIKRIIGMPVIISNVAYYIPFFSNFDLISSKRMLKSDPQIAVTWSVAIEEQFYLIWPLLFSFIHRVYFKWIFITIILACQLFRLFNQNNALVLYFHSFSVVSDLALGGLTGYYAFYSPNFKNIFTSLKKFHVIAIYILGFLWIFLGNLIIPVSVFNVFARFINTLFFCFIILEQCYTKQSFYKFSKNEIISLLGKYTFGMYILHMVALRFTGMIAEKVFGLPINNLHANLPYTIGRSLIGLLITFFISYVSFEYFEKIFMKFRHKFTIKPNANLDTVA